MGRIGEFNKPVKNPKGAGRKKGSVSAATKEVHNLLDSNKAAIVQRAIRLATDRSNPNIAILMKLLDKILPTLSAQDFKGMLEVDEQFSHLTDSNLNKLVQNFARLAANSKSTSGKKAK